MENLEESIKLAHTGDLMDELLSRFPHAIFIGLKDEGHGDKNVWHEIAGLEIECLGLYRKLEEHIDEHFSD